MIDHRKTPAELEKMRRAGLLVYQVLQKLRELAVEGVTTMDLEVVAEKMIADAGCASRPSRATTFRLWARLTSFVLCTSVNDMRSFTGCRTASPGLKRRATSCRSTPGVKLDGYYG